MINEDQTLCIIKPDATKRHLEKEIIKLIEDNTGLKTLKILLNETFTKEKAELFYQEHKDKPFFDNLIEYTISGPIFVAVLMGDDSVNKLRSIMGDAIEPAVNTIRHKYGIGVPQNSIHGSDSVESAKREINIFFP